MTRPVAFLLSLFVSPLLVAAAAPSPVRMAPLEVRFFDQSTGQWTANKLDSKSTFTGWNSGAGEGDVGGPATDAMLVVSLSSPGNDEEGVFLDAPLVLRATAGKKLVASRRVEGLLIPVNGRGYASLFMQDIQCAGRIDITATYKGMTKTARLNMDCGE